MPPTDCHCLFGYFNNSSNECEECPYYCNDCDKVTGACVNCSSGTRDIADNCSCKPGSYN